MKLILISVFLAFTFIACNDESGNKNSLNNSIASKQQEKQINISILLDLSDRISPQVNPDGQNNDIENIKTITEYFKSNMDKLGAYKAKGKIRIFLSPPPKSSDINTTVGKLKIDCSKMDNKERKIVYDSITGLYVNNLERVYNNTITTSAWEGSDIWRFFKDDVKDFCMEKDTNYRNILIILTDGYLFHQQTLVNNQNRYTYLLGNRNLLHYRVQNWEQKIKDDDFGIITERNDLKNLEVLVLEVRAENSSHKIDEDIMRYLWKKWFKEMNVSHSEVYNSDLPANTKTRIENFLNQD